MEERQERIIEDCESLGENEVRRRFYASQYSADRDRLLIEGWLSSKEAARRETSEQENKSIARKTLGVTVVAAIAAIIASIPVITEWLK